MMPTRDVRSVAIQKSRSSGNWHNDACPSFNSVAIQKSRSSGNTLTLSATRPLSVAIQKSRSSGNPAGSRRILYGV